jgi:HAD superfamily hydrolase (TIGR01549 family)
VSPGLPYRVLLFDLFGTIVQFTPDVPETQAAGRSRRSAMGWLEEQAGRELPGVPFDGFLDAMREVTEEIIQARPPEHHEVQSRERFRRALACLGYCGDGALAIAERLSLAHMAHLAARTEMPAPHGALLRELSDKLPVGLVSNFDHAPTAHSILRREGIADLFAATIISAEMGRRKPHPSIFHAALLQLDGQPEETLFVGDSLADDVLGGHAAGIDVAWINSKGIDVPAGTPVPRYQIRSLPELSDILGVA